MRVVVDTDVFVSAALKDNSFPALALQIVDQRHTLLKSPATESQLVEVITRPRIAALIDPASVERICKLIASAEMVTITERIAGGADMISVFSPHGVGIT
jgi:predicted nucleic acid-binding protein